MIEYRSEGIADGLPGLVLVSHGKLALEMIRSAEMICGPLENVSALCLEPTDDLDEYREKLSALLNLYPSGAFLLIDLFGGTPFNSVVAVSGERNLHGVTGVNLGVLLEVASMRDSMSLSELGECAEETLRASMINLKKFQEEI